MRSTGGGAGEMAVAVMTYEALAARFPAGLPEWIQAWIRRAAETNRELAANGALGPARARCRLIVHFLEAATEWYDAEVDVAEAAQTLGRCEETVRRAIRGGALPDRRSKSRGRHRIRRGDLPAGPADYDSAADAIEILKRRRAR